jgi:hypothetical protein
MLVTLLDSLSLVSLDRKGEDFDSVLKSLNGILLISLGERAG